MPATQTRRNRKANTTKGQAEPAAKVKPIDALNVPKRTVKTVTLSAEVAKLPNGLGGVRFTQTDSPKVIGDFYVEQSTFAKLGKANSIKVTIEVA